MCFCCLFGRENQILSQIITAPVFQQPNITPVTALQLPALPLPIKHWSKIPDLLTGLTQSLRGRGNN